MEVNQAFDYDTHFGLNSGEYQKLEDCVKDHFNFSLKTLRTLQEDKSWDGKSILEHVREATPYYQSQPKYSTLFSDCENGRGGEICDSLVASAILNLEQQRELFSNRKRYYNRYRSRASKATGKRTFETPSCNTFRTILPKTEPNSKSSRDSSPHHDQNRKDRCLRRIVPAPKENLTTETSNTKGPSLCSPDHHDRIVSSYVENPVSHPNESEDIPQIHLERAHSEDDTDQGEDLYEHSPCPSTGYHIASRSNTPARHRRFPQMSRYLHIECGETEDHGEHTECSAFSPTPAAQYGPHVYYHISRPWQSPYEDSNSDQALQSPCPPSDPSPSYYIGQGYIAITADNSVPPTTKSNLSEPHQPQTQENHETASGSGYRQPHISNLIHLSNSSSDHASRAKYSDQGSAIMNQKALPSFKQFMEDMVQESQGRAN